MIEGKCAVCHEDLDPAVADIKFYRAQCGQNIHQQCTGAWVVAQPEDATCPMCHVSWADALSNVIHLDTAMELDPKIFQTYIDWLYTNRCMISGVPPEYSEYIVCLLKVLNVAFAVEDGRFQEQIVAMYISAVDKNPNHGLLIDPARYVYEASKHLKVQGFLVLPFISRIEPASFAETAAEFPKAFLLHIGTFLMKSHGKHDLHDLVC